MNKDKIKTLSKAELLKEYNKLIDEISFYNIKNCIGCRSCRYCNVLNVEITKEEHQKIMMFNKLLE